MKEIRKCVVCEKWFPLKGITKCLVKREFVPRYSSIDAHWKEETVDVCFECEKTL